MVKPYSQDLRERVILAVEEGELSRREAAKRYRVSPSSAVKWLQQYRGSGRRHRRSRWRCIDHTPARVHSRHRSFRSSLPAPHRWWACIRSGWASRWRRICRAARKFRSPVDLHIRPLSCRIRLPCSRMSCACIRSDWGLRLRCRCRERNNFRTAASTRSHRESIHSPCLAWRMASS